MTYSHEPRHNGAVKPGSIRASIDYSRKRRRRLHETAAQKGRSARRLSLKRPIIPSTGRKIDLTNEQIYDLIEFP